MRKGISQVISSIMLLAIAVAIAGVYSQWAPGFSEDASKEAVEQSNNRIKCSNADINIADARYDISGQVVELELENTGTIRLSDDIQVATLRSSRITNSTTVSELDVEETEIVRLRNEETPDTVAVSSRTCPDISIETSRIDVTK